MANYGLIIPPNVQSELMDLNEIKVFVKVVQAGSFNRAAKLLGIPNSTVSAKVSALEKRLSVTLLKRTTRKLSLTEAGEIFFRRCLKGLDEIQDAEAEASSAQEEAKGLLRVTAPIDLGSTCLMGLISTLRKKFPQIAIELILSDEFKDLVSEGMDLAIRAGHLKDSGLIAKKLGNATWVPFASPSYLKKAGAPNHPKELGKHPCLQFFPLTSLTHEKWELTNGKTSITVPIRAEVSGNDVNLIKALTVAGNGIALLPSFACHAEVKQGKLVRILPSWSAFTDPIHLLYPDQKFVPSKVRAFIEVAIEEFHSILKE